MYKELRKTPFQEMVSCPSPPSLGRKEGRNTPNVRKKKKQWTPFCTADVWRKCTIRRKQLNGISRDSHKRCFTRKTAKSKMPGKGQQPKPEELSQSTCLLVMIKVYESHESWVGHATVPEPDTAVLSASRTTKPQAVPGVLDGDRCVETLFQGLD